MNEIEKFKKEVEENIKTLGQQKELKELSIKWLAESAKYKYSYNFTWMGRPIIQYPQDMIAIQEIIHQVDPDVIVETGIAHGGSIIFSASMLQLMGKPDSFVVGVDIDIREHNKKEIEKSRFINRIKMIQGSSIDPNISTQVHELCKGKKCLVILDSNHTHEHVLEELRLYQDLVSVGSYLIVLDSSVEDMPDDLFKNRPWNKQNNPKTAIRAFLEENNRFKIDQSIDDKIQISVAYSGFLLCTK